MLDKSVLSKEVEEMLYGEIYGQTVGRTAFNLGQAQLHIVHMLEADNAVLFDCTLADTDGDIYDLVSSSTATKLAKNTAYLALVTCGWAAPLEAPSADKPTTDIPPSQHAERKRVRLTMLIDTANGEQTTVIRFEGNDEVTVEPGNATGSLADAVTKMVKRATKQRGK